MQLKPSTEAHHDTTVIPHPIGKIAKEAMLRAQTLQRAPALLPTNGEETETLPTNARPSINCSIRKNNIKKACRDDKLF